jgi:hypothetical protein
MVYDRDALTHQQISLGADAAESVGRSEPPVRVNHAVTGSFHRQRILVKRVADGAMCPRPADRRGHIAI